MATSSEYGWVNGYPDGTFEPDKNHHSRRGCYDCKQNA
ncbi:hypothetical protein [Paenibacillus sedimenti]|uniref:Uncharacterized protein n=1 Tax=Paenibacillus sedimenti TaxID=2770274 RepID=A0A926KWT9_9BACL|nr:hypothetical protein [Paenibacillus sedimenti]